ncbi:hypothetical protein QUW40_09170 [Collinsella tanakaei]|uniref:hypothetical protein n=1 Tax=Collinsella tanakaei TaxID=626935 RepID=UPI0025A42301|nr:hypothetical protein [Collinsella tanakaei]MDM8246766.1 hypothetical protein [Collinsella tanakaei]
MSTRNPMNKRSQAQQSGEMTGFTRKSAGSAKPARAAASSVRVVPASAKEKRKQVERGESLEGLSREEKRARKRELRLQEDRIYTVSNVLMKDDPDYNKRRRVFWVLLVVAVIAAIGVWVVMLGLPEEDLSVSQPVQIVGLIISYACIIGAFVYDLVRVRPLRNEARRRAEGMSEAKLIAVLEEDKAKEAAKREAKKKK